MTQHRQSHALENLANGVKGGWAYDSAPDTTKTKTFAISQYYSITWTLLIVRDIVVLLDIWSVKLLC